VVQRIGQRILEATPGTPLTIGLEPLPRCVLRRIAQGLENQVRVHVVRPEIVRGLRGDRAPRDPDRGFDDLRQAADAVVFVADV